MKNLPLTLSCLILAGCASVPERVEPPPRPGGIAGIVVPSENLSSNLRTDLRLPADLQGLLVFGVERGSPGEACGLSAGDFLSKIDGEPLAAMPQITAKGAGARVSFEVWRKGASRTAACTLAFPPAALGASVLQDKEGVLIITPPEDPNVQKALRRLNWQEYHAWIQSLDGQPVTDLNQIKAVLAKHKPFETVTLELRNRSDEKLSVSLRLSEGTPTGGEFSGGRPAHRPPRTLAVSPDGTADFLTPQGALLLSEPGDTILVRAGHYEEPLIFDLSNRTLRGEGDATVLSGLSIQGVRDVSVEEFSVLKPTNVQETTTTIAVPVSVSSAHGVSLRKLSVTGGGVGVLVNDSSEVTVKDCRVQKAGIGLLFQKSEGKAERCVLCGNNDGLVVQEQSVAGLRSLTVADNRARGLAVRSSKVELYDSIFAGTPTLLACYAGCRLLGGYNDYYEGNLCWTEADGQSFSCEAASNTETRFVVKKENDLSVDPLFTERLKDDYRLSLESPLIGHGRGGGHIGALPPAGAQTGAEGFR